MVFNARFPFALIAGSATLLCAASCTPQPEPAGPPPEPLLLPPVASIRIVPANVSVPMGTSFMLQAQLRDASGTQLSDPRTDSVSWRVTQGLTVLSSAVGSSVVVNTLTQAAASPTIIVVASMNAVSASSTIQILPAVAAPATAPASTATGPVPTELQVEGTTGNSVATPEPDWIRAPHIVNGLPTIVLVDGTTGGKLRNDETFAFADSRELDAFDCNGVMCGEITVFSPALGIRRDTVAWRTACDYVDFVGGLAGPSGCSQPTASSRLIPIPGRVRVPVVIWQASSSPEVLGRIAQDVAYALSVFNHPWRGLTLDVTVNNALAAASVTYYGACDDPDYDITHQLRHAIPPGEFTPDRITVAYVDDISDGTHSAFACPYDPAEGAIALISKTGAGGSTLAHELGHALGQWLADSTVHADPIPGMDESNLMWSAESGDTRSIRSYLTLGQLFQMSLRDSSFVKRSPSAVGNGLQCPPKPGSDTPCPQLAKDVIW